MSDEDNSAYSLTLKAATGFDAPWLVIRAGSIEQLHDKVKAVEEHAFFATAGSAAKNFQAAYQLGKQLGAEPTSPPKEPAKRTAAKKTTSTAKKSTAKAEPEAEKAEAPVEEKPAAAEKPAGSGRARPTWKR